MNNSILVLALYCVFVFFSVSLIEFFYYVSALVWCGGVHLNLAVFVDQSRTLDLHSERWIFLWEAQKSTIEHSKINLSLPVRHAFKSVCKCKRNARSKYNFNKRNGLMKRFYLWKHLFVIICIVGVSDLIDKLVVVTNMDFENRR